MNSTQREDQSTEAVIEVTNSPQNTYGGISGSAAVLGQAAVSSAAAALSVDYAPVSSLTTTIVNTVAFSYSSDVCQLGDPFSVRVPDPRGIYRDKFVKGQTIKLSMRNPNVEGGGLTTKCLGIIVDRVRTCNSGGTALELTCADLGWHLLNCDAPYWGDVQNGTLYDLLTDPDWISPTWGIRAIATDNETNRLIKQRINQGRAQQAIDLQQALGLLTYIQVEPGDKIADHLATYARRLNRLINVSADGYLQIWRPDYNRDPLFAIELHEIDDPARNKNNVLDVSISDSISDVYTEVNCVWEQVGGDTNPDPANQNWGKDVGSFVNEFALPFYRRCSFSDGDLYNNDDAKAQSFWRYSKGIFDSFQAVYTVKGHWQKPAGATRAYWWESDQMCSVNDTVNGLSGLFYVAAVRCDRDERGDRTIVTLRKPALQASFGEYPRAPVIQRSIVDTTGKTSETPQTVRVVK